jgi:hypothetical protein
MVELVNGVLSPARIEDVPRRCDGKRWTCSESRGDIDSAGTGANCQLPESCQRKPWTIERLRVPGSGQHPHCVFFKLAVHGQVSGTVIPHGHETCDGIYDGEWRVGYISAFRTQVYRVEEITIQTKRVEGLIDHVDGIVPDCQ